MLRADESQVHTVVHDYVLAVSTADEQKLRSAFHPAASIIGNYQGALEWLSVDAYVSEVMAAGLAPNSTPDLTVSSLDITGDAALVKVESEFGSMKFTDYLSLLKIAGEWKIIGKLYHMHA